MWRSAGGTVPERRRLAKKLTLFRSTMRSKSAGGMVPESCIMLSWKSWRAEREPSCEGIVPEIGVVYRPRPSRAESEPSCEAIVPEISRCVLLAQGQLVSDGPSQQVLQSEPLSQLFGTPLQVLEANGYRQVLPG